MLQNKSRYAYVCKTMLVEMRSFLISRSALTEPDCKYNAIVLVKQNEYLGGIFMAKEVSKVIPIAERIIEFGTDDFRKNALVTLLSKELISDEEWSKFAGNALVIMDGWNVVQYAEEYPIVRYQCDKNVCIYLDGEARLNSFVESITVSAALYGKRAGFGSGKLNCENTDYDVVVYYTDHAGINHAIIQHDICWFLLQKPKLVVSPEGVLVFFTDKEIIATLGCNNSYHWISENVINVEGRTIKNIEVCEDYCKVILLDDNKVEHSFSLKFDFDGTSYQILNPKALIL